MANQLLNVTTLTEDTSVSMVTVTRDYSAHLSISLDPRHTDPPDLDPGGTDLDDVWRRIDLIHLRLRQAVFVPMASLGVIGNGLSLWVWSAETAYNSTVFMLKALALWDLLFLMVHLMNDTMDLVTGTSSPLPLTYVFIIIILVTQISSIYTTLLSSLTRLLAIHRPAHFNQLLSRPRVLALCVLTLLWSVLLSSLEASWYVCLLTHSRADCQHLFSVVNFYRENYLYDLLAFCIPSFLLLFSNVLTVYKFSRHRSEVSGTSSNQSRGDKTRRLSITMIVISVTSLLTYPVAVSVRLGLNPGQAENDVCDLVCFYTVTYMCGLLITFNSCVNVVYYFVISSRFRELWVLRVRRLCRLCRT
ncbi:uncharacterized protein LOC143275224 [Babylonia areolata]|uniref:uncharacterized protein LOC143275224 n=1 Tax=Babylonia areolata TaxID=304850 RepID=UPI003FD25BEF